jgi:hypothetical protein
MNTAKTLEPSFNETAPPQTPKPEVCPEVCIVSFTGGNPLTGGLSKQADTGAVRAYAAQVLNFKTLGLTPDDFVDHEGGGYQGTFRNKAFFHVHVTPAAGEKIRDSGNPIAQFIGSPEELERLNREPSAAFHPIPSRHGR